MATEKQIDWAVKLARWNKQDISRADVEALSAEQLDELFANLKKVTVSKKPAVEKSVVIKQPDFNGARFGLACKIALQGHNLDCVFNNDTHFIDNIIMVYDLMTKAEQRFQNSPEISGLDPEAQNAQMEDYELMARGLM